MTLITAQRLSFGIVWGLRHEESGKWHDELGSQRDDLQLRVRQFVVRSTL